MGSWHILKHRNGVFEVIYVNRLLGRSASCGFSPEESKLSDVQGWVAGEVQPGDAIVMPGGLVLPVLPVAYA